MTKFDSADVQVDYDRVLVAQKQKHGGFNWVCVATFHHQPGIGLRPEQQAKNFARSIIR